MRTGEMKYVILRIDTHVLRIDLCPRKRTRIRRQKQDEDVHLFLSERPLPRGVYGRRRIWPGTRRDPNARTRCRGVSHTPSKRATGPNGWTPDMIIRPVPGRLVGRMQYAPTLPAGGPSGTRQTWLASLTPPAKFAGVRRHPTANAERLALLAQTPRQTPRDLRRLRKRHGKCRETRAACAHLLRIQNNL